jgi:ABC-type glycerol-3-phosphate transport system substrate-binding protein
MLTRYAALAAVVVGFAVLASTASADPTGAKNSLTFPASCDNGQTIEVVVNGNGEWTPAHVVGSTAVFVPRAFDTTFEFTPVGGPTETMTDTSAKANQHGDLVTCSFDVTQVIPDVGTFHFFGSATGVFTSAS